MYSSDVVDSHVQNVHEYHNISLSTWNITIHVLSSRLVHGLEHDSPDLQQERFGEINHEKPIIISEPLTSQ